MIYERSPKPTPDTSPHVAQEASEAYVHSDADWFIVADREVNGVKYTRLGKSVGEGDDARLIFKDVLAADDELAVDRERLRERQVEGLGREAVHIVLDSSVASTEEIRKERLKKLFAFPVAKGRDRWGNNLDIRREVTAQSAADAATAYRYLDDVDVKDMIKRYANGAWKEEDMAEVVRANDELRNELGLYLLEKMDSMTHLPARMYATMTKGPDTVGYGTNLNSREYATLLALSMLDGTFKADLASQKRDMIEMRHGEVRQGQHRYTALKLLGLDTSPLARINRT